MKKLLSVFVLVLLLFGVVGCGEERTYKADGIYVAWDYNTTSGNVLNEEDGTPYTIGTGDTAQTFKSIVPVLSTVSVEIRNDEIVNYEIDERQSKAYVKETAADGTITKVTWKFNTQTKRELKYNYGMETNAKQGEWYQTIINLENAWLKEEPKALASVTIHHENYVELANEAIQKAKDGKASAVYPGEHYEYDVAYVTADVNEKGRLSNVLFDAWIFGYGQVAADVYDATSKTFNFTWAEKSKYDSYSPMRDGAKWQDQIDTLQDYIENNGFDGLLTTSGAANRHKGLHIANEVPTALSSVTVQVHGEITVLNLLAKMFPYGWDE